VTLPANTQSVNAFYADTVAQSPTISAGATGLTSGTQVETINAAAPNKFVFTSTAVSGAASSSASLGPITVQEQDTFGNATTTAETVNLASNSAGTAIFSGSPGGGAVTSVSISAGSSSVSFYYGDTKAGSPTITVSGSLTGTTQTETITAAAASTIAVSSGSGQAAAPNIAYASPLVALVTDSFGNPVSGVAVTFAGPATGASESFATGGNCTSNPHAYSCVATTGASGLATSSTFTANATLGAYTITANATGTNTANFSETNSVTIPALVQQVTLNVATNGTNTNNISLTLPGAIRATDTLVLTVADQATNGAIVNSVTEAGATWVKATSTGATGNGDAEIWYALNVPNTASTTITVALSHRTNVQLADVSEWSGVATTGALDQTGHANNTTASISAGSVTPTVTGELIISDAYLVNGNTTQPAASNGFTELQQSAGTTGTFNGYNAYLVDPANAAITTTWTEPGGAGPWSSAIATFRP